ncbi:STAS domain-containing protein [Synechococcus sp. CS-1328]|nr:STAS domain-containing protein [Synechococcus sp. CS-1328]
MFDLTDVSHLGVTAALAVENAAAEALEKGRQVYVVVGANGTTRKRLESLGLYAKLPADHLEISRHEAPERAGASLV